MRLLIIPALLIGGCAPVHPRDDGGAELARYVQGRVPAETLACVPVSQGRSLNVVDSGTLVYERGGTLWVNRLRSDCPGLGTNSTLLVELSSGQYCRGDRFRELESGASIPGPYCILGDFTAYRRPN